MIDNPTAKTVYTIQEGVTSYPIGFEYNYDPYNNPEISVTTYEGTLLQNVLEYGVDYNISANGLNVELVSNFEVGEKLIIMRNIALVQRSNYHIGRIDPEQIENDFDETVMRDQQLQAEIDIISEVPVDHEERIQAIESKIPDEATSTNQLADKAYVTTQIGLETTRATGAEGDIQTQVTNNKGTMDGHIANTSNPHSVTATQVGLGNCDNTSDLNKPISTATQSALDLKVNTADLGTAAYTPSTDYATAAQGAKADTALQPNDNVSSLVNDAGYLTSMSLDGLTDTAITSVADGEFLRYDDTAGKWVNAASSASIGFDGITGSPYDNIALGKELDTKTNCIAEIPQDIKLEIGGTPIKVILKSGSKVYVPNGVGVFDEVIIQSDVSGARNAADCLVFYDNTNDRVMVRAKSEICVGASDSLSGTPGHTWYDTTNNLIKHYSDGTTIAGYLSLPVGEAHGSDLFVDTIDQIFNGFGYIGSIVFALPGVKGLIPDGRNADGSLKNIEFISNSVKTRTFTTQTSDVYLALTGFEIGDAIAGISKNTFKYNEVENLLYDGSDVFKFLILGSCTLTSGAISNFTPKTTFHAVDYNDTEYMAHQSMPSDRCVNLTLPASGGSIIAPADGYVYLAKNSTAAGQRVKLFTSINMAVASWSTGVNNIEVLLPVSKGETVNIVYTADGTTNFFRFIYANGAQ